MTELIGVVGFVVLFAVSGLLRGRIQETEGRDCDSCKHDPDSCGVCHMVREISE
ncbi:MAG: hypothetical protein JSW71_00735 [Gemmatimonadota bacterium]|nr:MAG: hypothetical protein JSW71_00735 [Gemmatimonadota bacterium]